jgi:uncharacterized protein YecE (DUF72 family)
LTTVDHERSQAPRTSSPRGGLRVGCSGWSYKDWRGIVYPDELPQRLGSVLDAGRDVYAYFDNDVDGHAVHDALHLRRALTPDA